jgi:hypothetical protein
MYMMRFLKSILLRDKKETRLKEALYMLKRDFEGLQTRVSLLEEENKKTSIVIGDLSSCMQNIAVLVSDLSIDVNAFSLYLKAQLENDKLLLQQAQFLDSPGSDDDDGGGYLN